MSVSESSDAGAGGDKGGGKEKKKTNRIALSVAKRAGFFRSR